MEIHSIHYASLSAMFNPLHSISNQGLFKKHLFNPHISKEMVSRSPAISIIVYKVKHPLHFVVGCVQPITQQYESRTVRKVPLQSKQLLLKIQTVFIMKGAITCYRQIYTFAISKDEWDTKEDTGKSMKNALYIKALVRLK